MTSMDELTAARRRAFTEQPFDTLCTGHVVTTDAQGIPQGVRNAPPMSVVELFARRLVMDLVSTENGTSEEAYEVLAEWTMGLDRDMTALTNIALHAVVTMTSNPIHGSMRRINRAAALELWDTRIDDDGNLQSRE